MSSLNGKVAIVTGSGQGLGRVEALALAQEGAAVVVNDLGTNADGSGASEEPARAVVKEIEAAGGRAVAAFGDVADWQQSERIVKAAVDAFGDLHILVNNAGFSRDGMIVKMTEEMWDSVIRVHAKGHFCMIRHTMSYWRDRSKANGGQPVYGRLISTASDAFMMGNLGQPNYAAAKAAITHLTLSAARECQRMGATANVILPRARTRMTSAGPWAAIFQKPAEGFDTFSPEHIGPVVAWLASPHAANVSGNLLQVWGKHVRVYAAPKPVLDHENDKPWTVDELQNVLGPFFEKRKPIEDSFALPMAWSRLQVYASIDDVRMPLAAVPAHAQRAERLGCDGLVVPEAVYDAIPAATLALAATTRLCVATGVVVAFARSPMLLAQDAWALAQLSGGRFELGLGPQVKGNVEKRFGMPWSAPAARMHDYVDALRAVFASWQHGTPLRHEGASYTLTRMQPFFAPEKLTCAEPPILLGAIGPKMIGVAGEVADGLIAHPTNSTPGYLRDVVRPGLLEGARKAGRAPSAIRVIANPMTATGPDAATVAAEREAAREVLAFTYSTPAYWPTLEHHGWGEVGRALLARTKAGQWEGMRALVSDAMLDALVPTAPFGEIAALLRARYTGVADALTLRLPRDPAHDAAFARVIETLRQN